MSYDIELFDESQQHLDTNGAPPLCLVHYFGATGQGPPEVRVGRIAERDGNLLILDFAPPPDVHKAKRFRKRVFLKPADALFLLLLLVSFTACLAAFRF